MRNSHRQMRFATAIVAAVVPTVPALAAPISYLDPAKCAQQVTDCFNKSGFAHLPPDRNQDKAAAYQICWFQSMPSCVSTVDIPTASELQTALDNANQRQRDEWKTWLDTLKATGVVKANPPPAPAPVKPAPH